MDRQESARRKADLCRDAAIELLHRAQAILEAGGCGCASLPGELVCSSCTMQQSLDMDIQVLEVRS
jgi:hypothetical protein